DYCCVHACYALSDAGYETIMINCNPETVSTDYDTSDRLYFEPLTDEDVISVIKREAENGDLRGVIVQLGGQTPLKIAAALEAEGIPILGTSPDAIDLAEDRERFQQLLQKLNLLQPENGIAHSAEEARTIVERIGLPVVIRPSYVLGGRAMEVVHQMADLERYMRDAVVVSGSNPVLIDRFLNNAIEVDVDALCDGSDVYIGGIMEHIEEAGIHSGDSACSLPPQHLSDEILAEIRRQTSELAFALNVVGLMNIQFAIREDKIYLLEVNPRGSRTVPFVAKTTGVPLAKIASRVMAGEKLAGFNLKDLELPHVAVKEAVFPFARFPGVDVFLGPEMKSTGEVMGIDRNFGAAFAKSQLGAGVGLPLSGTVFISVKDEDKPAFVEICRNLVDDGFKILATGGTTDALNAAGVPATRINKVMEGRPHAVDAMLSGEIQLVFNTAKGAGAIKDSFSLRHNALTNKIPYYTTVSGSRAAAEAIRALRQGQLGVRTLQDYLADIKR
ncbi:MAG: carbamoyl-phosphate synthase large subunit, partial [Candidatus Puniceispirillaceae bacterium]